MRLFMHECDITAPKKAKSEWIPLPAELKDEVPAEGCSLGFVP